MCGYNMADVISYLFLKIFVLLNRRTQRHIFQKALKIRKKSCILYSKANTFRKFLKQNEKYLLPFSQPEASGIVFPGVLQLPIRFSNFYIYNLHLYDQNQKKKCKCIFHLSWYKNNTHSTRTQIWFMICRSSQMLWNTSKTSNRSLKNRNKKDKIWWYFPARWPRKNLQLGKNLVKCQQIITRGIKFSFKTQMMSSILFKL